MRNFKRIFLLLVYLTVKTYDSFALFRYLVLWFGYCLTPLGSFVFFAYCMSYMSFTGSYTKDEPVFFALCSGSSVIPMLHLFAFRVFFPSLFYSF